MDVSSQNSEKQPGSYKADKLYLQSHDGSDQMSAMRALRPIASGGEKAQAAYQPNHHLHSGDTLTSPPRLRRGSDPLLAKPTITHTLASSQDAEVAITPPGVQTLEPLVRNGESVTDTEFLHASEPKLRRGASDDNGSDFSGETRLSGSASSRTRESTCWKCKGQGHTNLPLVTCSTCSIRLHASDSCINPSTCDVRSREVYRCMKCVSKGSSCATVSFQLAEKESKRPTPSCDAISRSKLLLSGSKPGTNMETKANSVPQRHDLHHNIQDSRGDSSPRISAVHPSSYSTGLDVVDRRVLISRQKPNHVRSMDLSHVPNTPAAMREVPLPTLSRPPHINNLLDSYRPEPPTAKMNNQRSDSYARPGRSQPPPLHPEKEREDYLCHAPKAEKNEYLQQHRRAICKEITCVHWHTKGICREGDDCIYSHEDTHAYFPHATRPAKRWTCFFWLSGDPGCSEREEDCLFAHYDTGLYTNRRGQGSTKHVTCSWWSEQGFCYKGEDCLFAHSRTGIEAVEIGCPRPKVGFEQKSQYYRPQAPSRQTSNSWLPQGTISPSPSLLITCSPPPIRDTPLSPIEPDGSGSGSESEYEPPTIKNTAPIISPIELFETSTHIARPQPIIKPSSEVEHNTAVVSAGSRDANVILQPAASSISMPLASPEGLKLAIPTPSSTDTAKTPASMPKQYARRTGGIKRSHTGDPRLRKPTATNFEPSLNSSGERSVASEQGEAQIPSMSQETHSQPVGALNLLRCQTCKTLILAKQVMSHRCRVAPENQTVGSQAPPPDFSSSRDNGMIGMSQVSHTLSKNISTTGHVEQRESPDVSNDQQEIDQISGKTNLTNGSIPNSAFHGAKRGPPGSEIDAMFIPSKKRKVDPYVLLRTTVSSNTKNVATITSPILADLYTLPGVQLSIPQLTELEALRKEFEIDKGMHLDDDITALKSLQARKRKRLAEEDAARLLAEAAELEQRTAKRRADMELELKEQEQAVAKRRAERELKLKEEEEAEKAEFDRIRAARKEHEILRRQAGPERSKPYESVDKNRAYHGPSSSASSLQESTQEPAQWLLRGTGVSTPVPGVTVPNSSRDSVGARLDNRGSRAQDFVSSDQCSANPANSAIDTTPAKEANFEPANQDDTDNEVTTSLSNQLPAACSRCQKKHRKCEHRGTFSGRKESFGEGTDNSSVHKTVATEASASEIVSSPLAPQVTPRRPISVGKAAACSDCRKKHWKCKHKPIWSGGQEGFNARADKTAEHEAVTQASERLASRVAAGSSPPQDIPKKSLPLDDTHEQEQIHSSKTNEKPKTQLSTTAIENRGAGDDVYPNCDNCASSMWKGNCHRNYLQRKDPPPLCNKCYKYLWRTGEDRPVASPPASQALLELAEDNFGEEVDGGPPLAHSVNSVSESECERLPQCDHCKVKTSKRIRRWKSTDYRLCDRCYMYRYNHEGTDRPIERQATKLSCSNCGLLPPKRLRRLQLNEDLLCDRCYVYRVKNNAARPVNSQENNEDAMTDDAATSHAHPWISYGEAGEGFTYHLAKENKCLTAQCIYCGWKQTQNSTLEKQHRRTCSKTRPFIRTESSTKHMVPNRLHPSTPNAKLDNGYGPGQMDLENDKPHENVLVKTSNMVDNHSLAQKESTAAIFIFFQEEGKKCLTVQCTRCGWERARNPTREKEHQRKYCSGNSFQERNNTTVKVANGVSQTQCEQQRSVASGLGNPAHALLDRPTTAAVPKTRIDVPSEVTSRSATPDANHIAPGEIQALFCGPPPVVPDASGVADRSLPLSIRDHVMGKTARLVQPKLLSEEEVANVEASMRAQGIHVVDFGGTYAGSDTSWSDSDMSETDSYFFQPVSLVQGSRCKSKPDPRGWVDEEDDDKSRSFDMEAARRKIQARPGRNANVKARRNGTRPGKLLAMSDWQTRVRRYGNLHRETNRELGPQKVGTFIREVADRTKLTMLKGFDDPETARQEVQGTMREFLGLPRQMKYDLIGAPRLVAARTLAFSDATGRERVPDRDKFPVGMGA